jgi:hypothetical protein
MQRDRAVVKAALDAFRNAAANLHAGISGKLFSIKRCSSTALKTQITEFKLTSITPNADALGSTSTAEV